MRFKNPRLDIESIVYFIAAFMASGLSIPVSCKVLHSGGASTAWSINVLSLLSMLLFSKLQKRFRLITTIHFIIIAGILFTSKATSFEKIMLFVIDVFALCCVYTYIRVRGLTMLHVDDESNRDPA